MDAAEPAKLEEDPIWTAIINGATQVLVAAIKGITALLLGGSLSRGCSP